MPPLLQLQKLPGKGDGVLKKSVRHFLPDQKIMSSWRKKNWGHPIVQAISYYLLLDTF